MKITKKQLNNLIKEEVNKQKKIIELKAKKEKLQECLSELEECDIEEGLGDVFKSEQSKAVKFASDFVAKATQAGKKIGRQWLENSLRDKFKLKPFEVKATLRNVTPLFEDPKASEEYSIQGILAKKGVQRAIAEGQEVVNAMPRKETESIFDAKPGETVIFNFNGTTIKIQRQLDDLFKVVDATESRKLKNGDYLRAQGNDVLEQGRTFRFAILREVPVTYETRPLEAWKIIRN